jgi:hypothetical protein
VGISDDPIEARFGLHSAWSEHEDGFRYNILLIDRRSDDSRADDDRKPFTLNLEADGASHALAYRIELMDRLLALLITKDLLTAEEVEAMKTAAMDAEPTRHLRFAQVADARVFFG